MTHTKKHWIAIVLSILAPPLAMLYIKRPKTAFIFLALVLFVLSMGFMAQLQIDPSIMSLTLVIFSVAYSIRMLPIIRLEAETPWYSRWQGLTTISLFFITFILLFRTFVIEPFKIPSRSMNPTLPVGSLIAAQKYSYGNYGAYGIRLIKSMPSATFVRGDIIVFEFPTNRTVNFVGRIIGLPNDRIEYRSKKLSVNGVLVTMDSPDKVRSPDIFEEHLGGKSYSILIDPEIRARDFSTTVQEGHLFMMGDNRDNALDSRYWDGLPFDHVVGKVVSIVQPWQSKLF